MPEHFRIELKHFFENYKMLENKVVIVDEFQGREKASEIIAASIVRYHKAFPGEE